MVSKEGIHRLFRESRNLLIKSDVELVEEVDRQKGNIFRPIPKRGDGDGDDIDSKKGPAGISWDEISRLVLRPRSPDIDFNRLI
jgi:hypothetical protein